MQLSVLLQAFNRQDITAIGLDGEDSTGFHRFAV
jgi:hypothetical protein